MYELKITLRGKTAGFATIYKDGKGIESLSGLYVANSIEINQLRELVDLANQAAHRSISTSNAGDLTTYPK